MSKFNIGSIQSANININMGKGERYDIEKLSVNIDGKDVVVDKKVSMKVENGVLLITTENE